jgi:hypothetical protein
MGFEQEEDDDSRPGHLAEYKRPENFDDPRQVVLPFEDQHDDGKTKGPPMPSIMPQPQQGSALARQNDQGGGNNGLSDAQMATMQRQLQGNTFAQLGAAAGMAGANIASHGAAGANGFAPALQAQRENILLPYREAQQRQENQRAQQAHDQQMQLGAVDLAAKHKQLQDLQDAADPNSAVSKAHADDYGRRQQVLGSMLSQMGMAPVGEAIAKAGQNAAGKSKIQLMNEENAFDNMLGKTTGLYRAKEEAQKAADQLKVSQEWHRQQLEEQQRALEEKKRHDAAGWNERRPTTGNKFGLDVNYGTDNGDIPLADSDRKRVEKVQDINGVQRMLAKFQDMIKTGTAGPMGQLGTASARVGNAVGGVLGETAGNWAGNAVGHLTGQSDAELAAQKAKRDQYNKLMAEMTQTLITAEKKISGSTRWSPAIKERYDAFQAHPDAESESQLLDKINAMRESYANDQQATADAIKVDKKGKRLTDEQKAYLFGQGQAPAPKPSDAAMPAQPSGNPGQLPAGQPPTPQQAAAPQRNAADILARIKSILGDPNAPPQQKALAQQALLKLKQMSQPQGAPPQ